MVQFLSVPDAHHTKQLEALDLALQHSRQHPVYLLVYMEGCGPCNATRPEWSKLKQVLRHPSHVVVADINKDVVDHLKHFRFNLASFPTMLKYEGAAPEAYEDADEKQVGEKDRTVDSFVRWIRGTALDVKASKTGASKPRATQKAGRRRRWSIRYKRSINCRRPRGFSQKQYCRYSRRHRRH